MLSTVDRHLWNYDYFRNVIRKVDIRSREANIEITISNIAVDDPTLSVRAIAKVNNTKKPITI